MSGTLLSVPVPLLVALLAVAAGAVAQSATGMGFSLVAAPSLVALLGPRDGVGTVLLLAALSSVVPLTRDWRHGRPRDVARVIVPTLLATPLVALALRGADTRWLALAAGAGVLAGVGLLASGRSWSWLRRPSGAITAGVSSAVLNVLGGVGGPPVGLWAANAGWSPRSTRATLQTYLLIQNLATVAVLGLVRPDWRLVLALVAGGAVGTLLAPRLPAGLGRAGVLGASLVGGVALVAGSI
jgi:uncharacterized membrane protein YfcA